jgi:5-methylcytosine-specific restriction endonuclease McrA
MDTEKTCTACKKTLSKDNFYAKQYRCKDCVKAHALLWQKNNPDKVKKSWKKQNKKQWAKLKQNQEYMHRKSIYRQENSEKRVAAAKAWNQANREKYNMHIAKSQFKRRTLKDARTYKILDKELIKLKTSPCAFCGSKENITIDHIIPISRLGNHSIGNLQSLCKSCNSKKKTKFISEYKYYLSKLYTPENYSYEM